MKDLAVAPALARLVVIKLGDTGLTDQELEVFLTSPHLGKLRHLDVSFNKLTDVAVDALCAAAARLPSLEYVNLAGNKLENPIEGYGIDSMSGIIVRDGCSLPERGEQLEAKYGPQRWLHAPSLLDRYPPTPADI